MQFKEYIEATRQTWRTEDDEVDQIVHAAMGLANEVGEYLADPSPEELGDVAYYHARLCDLVDRDTESGGNLGDPTQDAAALLGWAKKLRFQDRDDDTEVGRRLGKLRLWMLAQGNEVGDGIQQVRIKNIKKLTGRYPEGFEEGGGDRDTSQVTHTHEPDASDAPPTEYDRLAARQTRLEEEVRNLDGCFATQGDRIDEMGDRIDAVCDEQSELLGKIGDLNSRVGRVQGAQMLDDLEMHEGEGGTTPTDTPTPSTTIDKIRDRLEVALDACKHEDVSWQIHGPIDFALDALDRIDTPDASEPEPEPKAEGERVGSPLMQWLADRDHDDAFYLVEERIGYGQQKYGQHLHTDDGRDGLEDLRQELGDALLYAQKCRMNGRDLSEIRELVSVLAELVGCEGDASEPEGDTIPLESAQAFWTVESESGVRGVRRCYHPHDARLISVMTDRGMLYWPASTPVRVIDKGGE